MSTENKGRLSIKEMQELMFDLRLNYGSHVVTIDNMDTVNDILNYFGVTQDGIAFIYKGVIIPFIYIYTGITLVVFHPVSRYEDDDYENDMMKIDSIHEDDVCDYLKSHSLIENAFIEGAAEAEVVKYIKRRHNAIYYTDAILAAMKELSDLNTHIFWLTD